MVQSLLHVNNKRMIDYFVLYQKFSDYKRYHESAAQLPAVKEYCGQGGRILHWLPYKTKYMDKEIIPITKDFTHLYSNEVILSISYLNCYLIKIGNSKSLST